MFEPDAALPEPIAYATDPGEEWVRLPRRSGPLRRAAVVLGTVVVIALLASVWTVRWIDRQINPSGPPGDPVAFTILPRQTTNDVARELAAANVISNATVFRYWLQRQDGSVTFQAGEYDLYERMPFRQVLETLRAGPKPPPSINVTVPPGLTVSQMMTRLLAQLPGFTEEGLRQALVDPALDAPYQPELPFPIREGLLFPDTYSVPEEAATSELDLLLRMRRQMDRTLEELGAADRAQDLGLTVYEVLIVASLIEREAKVDQDRPKIARVIYNRLEAGELLGIDATTAYAVGKLAGEPLTVTDLDSDSPYNTRKVRGLPPTPIALASRASIEAALHPADGEWFYYVLTDEGGVEGAHTFAVTAAEFQAARQVCIEKGYCY